MDSAIAVEETGEGAFVASAGPGFAASLAGKGPCGAFVGESVSVLVGALAARLVAVETGSAGSSDDGECGGAPRARALCGAGVVDDWHLLVVPEGCAEVVRPSRRAG